MLGFNCVCSYFFKRKTVQRQFLSFTVAATIYFIYTKRSNLLLARNDDAGTLLIRNSAYSYHLKMWLSQKNNG